MIPFSDAGWYKMNTMAARTSTPRGGSIKAQTTIQRPGQRPRKRNTRWKILLLLLACVLVTTTALIAANLLRASTTLSVQVAGQPAVSPRARSISTRALHSVRTCWEATPFPRPERAPKTRQGKDS